MYVSVHANSLTQLAATCTHHTAALLPKTASSYEHPISIWRRRYSVLLVAVIAALLSADQNLLAPNVRMCLGSVPAF
jgi:hypothetical protein